jgi:hypothetical protein
MHPTHIRNPSHFAFLESITASHFALLSLCVCVVRSQSSLSEQAMGASTDVESARDRRVLKHVHDNVHGNIYLDPV